jgi:hypothetical protein
MKKRSLVIELTCFLFVLLFVYAAVSKLMEIDKFEVQLGKSPVTGPFASWVIWIVPGTEIGISLLLFFNRTKLVALYASFSLMVAFTTYIIVILHFGEHIPCSCGGVLQDMNWTQHLVFNVAFMLLGAMSVLIYPKENKNIVAQQWGNAENPLTE